VVVRDGARHRGEGRANEDYHCWGLPIVAPAAGTVVGMRDDMADNVPGRMDASVPPGNHVVLDHGDDEYSFLAHLQQGSVRVQVGDVVASGDTLGLCGNSGNSSEPHLHYHLQTTPDFGKGEGLPAQFLHYVADGEPVARGEPVQGQAVRLVDG
jgi:murein DD-endopeptidase MepM/ murein hydrolase activator NlpD